MLISTFIHSYTLSHYFQIVHSIMNPEHFHMHSFVLKAKFSFSLYNIFINEMGTWELIHKFTHRHRKQMEEKNSSLQALITCMSSLFQKKKTIFKQCQVEMFVWEEEFFSSFFHSFCIFFVMKRFPQYLPAIPSLAF
jgi:hypothetical protein